VAVTDAALKRGSLQLLAAALALPGVMPAHAQSAPDKGIFELQYLSYRDWQPGRNRMSVDAPAFYALIPLSDTWVVEGGHGVRRHVGCVAAVLQRALGRVDRRLPHRR